jgi:mannosyltransferase OCH1-like enzyme
MFVLNNFGEEWHKLFTSCRLGVVKANIWRCMVTYIHGGVYCDLDTICNDPIESWIKPEYDMTISRDDDGNPDDFTIYVFASKPKSKALELILNQIKINLKNSAVTKEDVISLSGETVWYNIIKDFEVEYNIYCYEKGSNVFAGKSVKHLGTFKKWDKNGYIAWMKENK